MTATTDFKTRLAFYRRPEHAIAQVLRARYGVIVTGDLPAEHHRGPVMSGNGQIITLADLQIFGAPRRGWIEIKTKKNPWSYHKYNRLEHGIDADKWDAYWRLQTDTALTVYLMVIEISTGAILMRDLHSIRAFGDPHDGEWPNTGKPSMNFDRSCLASVGQVHWMKQKYSLDFDVLDTFLSQLPLFEQ